MYISHIRGEGNRLIEAVDELIGSCPRGGNPSQKSITSRPQEREIGTNSISRDRARRDPHDAEGLLVTADMYNYVAGATGLNAAMPPWVQEGGFGKWRERLMDPAIRKRVIEEMRTPTDEWENLMFLARVPMVYLLSGFRKQQLKSLIGRRLSDVAAERGVSPEEAAIDLVITDSTRVSARVYFLMSEAERQTPDRAALGQFRLRCRELESGGRIPELESSPSSVRKLCSPSRQIRYGTRTVIPRSKRRFANSLPSRQAT